MAMSYSFDPYSYAGLDKLGRIRLSEHFHFREFLYSEIAIHYQLRNVPDDVAAAVYAGEILCQSLLEPLQSVFGRLHIRSGYRSRAVNAAGVEKHNCAQDNDGFHTWDYPHSKHGRGATACISIPTVSKAILAGQVSYEALAWWIHDNLPAWSFLEFFATPGHADEVCFNIGWHETPLKSMTTWRGGPRNLLARLPTARGRQDAMQVLLRACAPDTTQTLFGKSLAQTRQHSVVIEPL